MTLATENELLAGKYRVERVLGEGGMGVVVRATHVQLEQTVALKFLQPEALKRPALVARFAREAKALARLTTEHVARVIDVGTLDTGAPYIVMEYLDGEDMSSLIQRRGRLPVEEAASYLLQACEAIAEAHAARIVHRDLKPANLFLAHQRDGVDIVKVLDFGIAKALDDETSLTKTASGLGSAHYMAPEQMRNAKGCDERADLWAFGVILFELTTGVVPFEGDSVHEVVAAVIEQRRHKLTDLLPQAPPGLEALVDRCLEVDPAKRLASVADLAEGLARLADGPEQRASLAKVRRMLGLPSVVRPALASTSPDEEVRSREEIANATTVELPASAPALPVPTASAPSVSVKPTTPTLAVAAAAEAAPGGSRTRAGLAVAALVTLVGVGVAWGYTTRSRATTDRDRAGAEPTSHAVAPPALLASPPEPKPADGPVAPAPPSAPTAATSAPSAPSTAASTPKRSPLAPTPFAAAKPSSAPPAPPPSTPAAPAVTVVPAMGIK